VSSPFSRIQASLTVLPKDPYSVIQLRAFIDAFNLEFSDGPASFCLVAGARSTVGDRPAAPLWPVVPPVGRPMRRPRRTKDFSIARSLAIEIGGRIPWWRLVRSGAE
jgi:hypothetical protein